MRRNLTYSEECSAYPGRYVPMPGIEELLGDKEKCMTRPAMNMDEFDDFFKIEVSLPGVHKQDIVVHVKDNMLTIRAIHRDNNGFASRSQINEFEVNYFERQIPLPAEADPELTSAEYRDGILNLLIPKVTDYPGSQPGRIVVY